MSTEGLDAGKRRRSGAPVDFGKTAGDYARYRAGFPSRFFECLGSHGVGQPGQRVVDLGTGTGTLARAFAERGCRSTGLDIAPPLVREARRLDAAAGVEVDYVLGRAEETGLRPASADVVVAGQCWHWFDRTRAAAAARRTLVPGGWLVIAHLDWIPLPDNVAQVTEDLIRRHNPEWRLGGGTGIHSAWLSDVAVAGFVERETFSFDTDLEYSHEAWRGRIRASAGVAATLSPKEVAVFDEEFGHVLATRFPQDPLSVLHRVFAVVCRAP